MDATLTLPTRLLEDGITPDGIEAFTPEEVVAFIHGILDADCGMKARKELERSAQRYFEEYEPGTRFFVALRHEGRLCGLTAVDRYNDQTATLKWIFVDGEQRGRGLGSWLLDQALAFARSAGYEKVILCTATSMAAAHRLYQSRGFVFRQWVTFWRQRMQVYENVLAETGPDLPE